MKNLFAFIGFILFTLTLTGCATIFTGTKESIKISSNPPNTKVYSLNKQNQSTEIGVTPCVVTIKKKTPYLVFKNEGYNDEIYDVKANAKVEPIYWLNIFNAFFGALAVDIPSGAYLQLQTDLQIELKKKD